MYGPRRSQSTADSQMPPCFREVRTLQLLISEQLDTQRNLSVVIRFGRLCRTMRRQAHSTARHTHATPQRASVHDKRNAPKYDLPHWITGNLESFWRQRPSFRWSPAASSAPVYPDQRRASARLPILRKDAGVPPAQSVTRTNKRARVCCGGSRQMRPRF